MKELLKTLLAMLNEMLGDLKYAVDPTQGDGTLDKLSGLLVLLAAVALYVAMLVYAPDSKLLDGLGLALVGALAAMLQHIGKERPAIKTDSEAADPAPAPTQ